MVNFADAGQQYDGSLIPNGTIVKGVLRIKAFNADLGLIATVSKSNAQNAYLDVAVEITEGRYAGRKVFDLIGVAGSEKFVNNGRAAIKAIMEFNGASPQNMTGYELRQTGPDPVQGVDWLALDGKLVAAKVKIEKGNEGYSDKNKVAAFLTPLDPSLTKDWNRFMSGAWDAAPEAAKPAQQAAQPAWAGAAPAGTPPASGPVASGPAWGGGFVNNSAPAQPAPQPQQSAMGKPAWMQAAQAPQQQADAEIPF
jgi:hypothetical protein